MSISIDLQRRLLFIVHRGLVEVRLLAQAGKNTQAYDLADALEPIPGWIVLWKEEHLDDVRANIATYAAKYPDAFGYLDFLDKFDPPPF
jgi:hypothetical protein